MKINLFNKKSSYNKINDIINYNSDSDISDIYIIGNGPSLNNFTPKQFEHKFTIGTNRSWLWGNTNLLVWRDNRITEEIEMFELDKPKLCKWICSKDKSFIKNKILDYSYVMQNIDYTFKDNWMKKTLNTNIKWNGIVFHAIAIAKHINPDANIHLIGIDLHIDKNHHFFSTLKGFNQGFYNKAWDKSNFNYQKRLDMMYSNFKRLKDAGLMFKNYSNKSQLKDLFGVETNI